MNKSNAKPRLFIHHNRISKKYQVLSGHSGLGATVVSSFATRPEAEAFIKGYGAIVKKSGPNSPAHAAKHASAATKLRKIAAKPEKNPNFAGVKTRTTHDIRTDYWLISAKKSAATGKWIANFMPISGLSNFNRFTEGFATHASFLAKVQEIAKLKPEKLKNPSADNAASNEIANAMRYKLPEGKQIAATIKAEIKKPNFSVRVLANQLGINFGKKAGLAYWGARDAAKYGSPALYRAAGEIFIRNVQEGEF